MTVLIPVASLQVYLDITHPKGVADTHLGIEEVGTGITIMQSGIDDFHRSSVCCLQRMEWQQTMFPRVVQQLFHRKRSLEVEAQTDTVVALAQVADGAQRGIAANSGNGL